MRIVAVSVVILYLLASLPAAAQHGPSQPPPGDAKKPPSPGSKIIERMPIAPLHWKAPQVGQECKREVLPNGIVVYMLPDRSLPLVSVDVMLRTGSIYEKKERHGVAMLCGEMLRGGGTEKLTPEELDRKLESMSANLSTSIGTEYGEASLDVLTRNLDEGLQLLGDVLMHPRFSADKLDLFKEQYHEALRRRNDDPDSIVGREYAKLLYGNHPYGWELDWSILKNVTRADVVAWHERFFHPDPHFMLPEPDRMPGAQTPGCNIMLAVSGDFDNAQMTDKLRNVFGGWKPAHVTAEAAAPVADVPHPGVFLVQKDLTQTQVMLGHLSVNRNNPDRVAIGVMNYILGGGSFTSRVVEKIRNDEGLAYSVSTAFDIYSHDLGDFEARLSTKTPSTARAIALMLSEIRRMAGGQITPQELSDAKNAFANSFVFSFDTASEAVTRLMQLEFDGRPRDLYDTYLLRINQVTAADVERVARKYLHPDRATILVVGNPDKMEGGLEKLGPVKLVPLKEEE